MKMKQFIKPFVAGAMLTISLGIAAQQKVSRSFNYDYDNPEIINLPKEVNEISGIHYFENDHAVFAIDDDHGDLYKISLTKNTEIESWEFGKDRDYEDLIFWKNSFYILRSNGQLVYFPFSLPIKKIEKAELNIKGKNEFEILYKDPTANRLIMICKECKGDKGSNVSAYAFDVNTKKFQSNSVLTLNVSEIEDKINKPVGRFKPSAANVHPITGDIYIISSINKLLVITDENLHVKEVHQLDSKLFKQPEGLCFTPAGELIISNEASGKGNATLLLYDPK